MLWRLLWVRKVRLYGSAIKLTLDGLTLKDIYDHGIHTLHR